MSDCLHIKLNGSIPNSSNMDRFGELAIQIIDAGDDNSSDNSFAITANEAFRVYITGNANANLFKFSDNTNLGSTVDCNANTYYRFKTPWVAGGYIVHITNKYAITEFIISRDNAQKNKNILFNISQLSWCTHLTKLVLHTIAITGNIDLSRTALTYYDINSSKITCSNKLTNNLLGSGSITTFQNWCECDLGMNDSRFNSLTSLALRFGPNYHYYGSLNNFFRNLTYIYLENATASANNLMILSTSEILANTTYNKSTAELTLGGIHLTGELSQLAAKRVVSQIKMEGATHLCTWASTSSRNYELGLIDIRHVKMACYECAKMIINLSNVNLTKKYPTSGEYANSSIIHITDAINVGTLQTSEVTTALTTLRNAGYSFFVYNAYSGEKIVDSKAY